GVNRWQQDILNMWVQDLLDPDVFSETILLTPGVPHQLLRGMLEALPTRSKGFPPMAPELREATALTMQALNRCRWDRTALATLVYSLALASLAGSALGWSYRPIAGLFLIPPLLGLFPIWATFRLRHWQRRLAPLVEQGLDRGEFIEVARRLDWRP